MRESRCAPTLRLTRCSALSTVYGVAHQPLADRLVRVAVEVERQNRALELRQHAREARHQAVQLLAEITWFTGSCAAAPERLVEWGQPACLLDAAASAKRDVLVEGGCLLRVEVFHAVMI